MRYLCKCGFFEVCIFFILVLSLHVARLGSWQFLTGLPYSSLSATMMWHLVWAMHSGCRDTSNIRLQISLQECKKQLLGKSAYKEYSVHTVFSAVHYVVPHSVVRGSKVKEAGGAHT